MKARLTDIILYSGCRLVFVDRPRPFPPPKTSVKQLILIRLNAHIIDNDVQT